VNRFPEPLYSRRDVGAVSFALGLLLGLGLAFASCSPDEDHQIYSPTTEQGIR
jgi:hypothetical protein